MTEPFTREDADRDDGLLDVAALCRMFEESDNATYNARQLSERDRDYYDNKQWSPDEIAGLKKRRQPIITDNLIKVKVDYLDGVEKQQRIDPKALPRTPRHEADADGATEALRYVAQEQKYDMLRSAVWRNLLVEGAGGISVSVTHGKGYGGEDTEIELKRVAWDRMFFDPHSAEPDFSDAGYLGVVIWMNYGDAVAMYPDSKEALDNTIDSAPSQTYDDKPKFALWADKTRKRVRICQIWVKRDEQWYFAEFTKGGILKSGPSPFVTDKGETDCGLFFASAYVDRDNNRYGFVRELIPLQDEVNKRRSKSLHLLSVSQLHYEDGALMDDIETVRKELNRPDGTVRYAPGAMQEKRAITVNGAELATAHFQLLSEAKSSIDLKGPNATEMGDKTQGANAASGRAIIASQQGGMTQLAHLTDRLHDLDIRVFRAVWNRIRQFWTAEKWIRVTDDEQNVKWVGMNVDPAQMQMAMQQNPEAAQKIAGIVGSVAELDCDIIIDEAPDSLTPQLEQFQSLVELKKFDATGEIPFKSIVRASPNLKVKQQILKDMEAREQQQAKANETVQQVKMRGAVAEVQNTEADTRLKLAKAHEAVTPSDGMPEVPPTELENLQSVADINETNATAEHKRAQAFKMTREAELAPARLAHEARTAENREPPAAA